MVEEKKSTDTLSVHIIPDAFYAGKDPEIYHEKKEGESKKIKEKVLPEKKEPPKPVVRPTVQTGQITKPKTPLKKQKKAGLISKKIVGIGIFFLIVIGGISWYYLRDSAPTVVPPVPVPVSLPPKEITPPVVAPVTPSSTTQEDVTAPTSTPIQVLLFPNNIFLTSDDVDSDELTDGEEEIFQTDSGAWDTDLDGYYDGQEVANLYNPTGTAPEKIIDSGLVREYVNPTWQYRVYYPATWKVDAVDSDANQVLVSTITGEYIEIYALEKSAVETFISWFAKRATGQKYSDLIPLKNRFQVDGVQRKDGLVGYFHRDTVVFVVIYHNGTEKRIVYPHVIRMMLQSFRPVRTLIDIPDQVLLPEAPVMSSTTSAQSSTTDLIFIATSTPPSVDGDEIF